MVSGSTLRVRVRQCLYAWVGPVSFLCLEVHSDTDADAICTLPAGLLSRSYCYCLWMYECWLLLYAV